MTTTHARDEITIALSLYIEDDTLHTAFYAGENIAVNSYVGLGADGKAYESTRETAYGIAKNNAKPNRVVVVKATYFEDR